MRYLVFYDHKEYHCTVICKCKVLQEDTKWDLAEVKYIRGTGLTHKENIFDTLEEARKYAGHSNRLEFLEEVA